MKKEGLKSAFPVIFLTLVAVLSAVSLAAGPAELNQITCEEAGGDWQGTISGAACCGNDGEADNGIIASDQTHPNGWLCTYNAGSGGEWLLASQRIFAILSTGIKDKLSNGESWFTCEASALGQGVPAPSFSTYTEQSRAAKFTCTNTGEGFRYAECCVTGSGDERACQNAEAKRAAPGDASTMLIRNGFSTTFTTPDGLFTVPSLTTSNWNAFSNLSVIYKAGDPNLSIEVIGSSNQVLFSGLLLQYALNMPAPNKWIHSRIPIQQWGTVERVNLRYRTQAMPGQAINNNIFVDSMFFVPRSGNLQFCSGARYLAGSADRLWLDDADLNGLGWDNQPVGKSACNNIAAFGWTGNKCCGDDTRESFIDSEGACWRGDITQNNRQVPGISNVLFYNSSFWSCNYGQIGTGAIQSESCSVQGSYFCSVDDGWSNESSEGVPANSRNTIKSTPLGANLLRNPSFSEVWT